MKLIHRCKSCIHARKKKYLLFLVNRIYAGTRHFEKKRKLLRAIGFSIGEGTKVVGPLFCTGQLIIGENCWIGKNFSVYGNGTVQIEDCCDIAPDVRMYTGSHEIGSPQRRAGLGFNADIRIGSGCWIGAGSSILGGICVASGSVVATCACVCQNVEENLLVGGVPAKPIRKLSDD